MIRARSPALLLAAIWLGPLYPASAAQAAAGGASDPIPALGLLLSEGKGASSEEIELFRGAMLAADELAARTRPHAIRLVPAARVGRWESGASELVRLVYDENISALLGPADGRAAHLAEQVAARGKGRFVLLTPWATEAGLTRIKIPWFFRLAHDDRRQAEALLDAIDRSGGSGRVLALVSEDDYDARAAWEAFEREARRRGGPAPAKLPASRAGEGGAAACREARCEAVVFFLPPAAAAGAVRALRDQGLTAALFGPLRLACGAFLEGAGSAAEGMILAAPPEAEGARAERWRSEYRDRYGALPAAAAAYGYDGASVLIEALHSSRGGGGAAILRSLKATRREGLTGWIELDGSGNRSGPAPLARVSSGRLRAAARTHVPSRQAPDALPSR